MRIEGEDPVGFLLNFQINSIRVSSTLQLKCRTGDCSRRTLLVTLEKLSKVENLFGWQTSGASQPFHLSQTDSNRQQGRVFRCGIRIFVGSMQRMIL